MFNSSVAGYALTSPDLFAVDPITSILHRKRIHHACNLCILALMRDSEAARFPEAISARSS